MRDQFEVELAQYVAQFYPAPAEHLLESLRKMRDGDRYASDSVTGRMMAIQANAAWWAWQRSRACCVVELPQRFYMQPGDGPGVYPQAEHDGDWLGHDDVCAAIEAAGAKVAP